MIRDPLTGEAVLLGSTRSARPNEFRHGPQERCAFCPGNEDLTPPEIERIASANGGWSARAFRNLYPAISPPHGDHEVIVDSPAHDAEITRDGAALWRRRYERSLEREPSSFPVLFKNRGAYAGATILHPHTQMIVLPERPERWARMMQSERCSLCDARTRAKHEGTAVLEGERCSAFVRNGSRFALALSIVPHACAPSLLDADAEWEAVVEMLHLAASSLLAGFGPDTAFNVLVLSDPHAPAFHWHVELLPRLNTLAGFELSTGTFIRGAHAQESAEAWRRMIRPSDGSL